MNLIQHRVLAKVRSVLDDVPEGPVCVGCWHTEEDIFTYARKTFPHKHRREDIMKILPKKWGGEGTVKMCIFCLKDRKMEQGKNRRSNLHVIKLYRLLEEEIRRELRLALEDEWQKRWLELHEARMTFEYRVEKETRRRFRLRATQLRMALSSVLDFDIGSYTSFDEP